MCGIVGYRGSRDAPPRPGLLARMAGAIAHRGPDGAGTYTSSGVGLGHRRLSVIDPAGGAQPMSGPDRSTWITFNGEIFNYVELRDELRRKGHSFRTGSDTEVILHLYEEEGEACLLRLNGDFAFAIWDERRQRLFIARDRIGVRPIYYAERPDGFYFASEMKALLEVPGIDAEPDPFAVDQIFTFWVCLPPRTPFRGISELPPGHFITLTPDRMEIRRYWQPAYPDAHSAREWSRPYEERLKEELRALFLDSVKLRLRSDVPYGAYLSGGLDSSLVGAAANRLVDSELRTFSVTFEDPEFDESSLQRKMAAALQARYEAVPVSTDEIGRLFPQVIDSIEQPVLRTGAVPLYRLAGHVRECGVKVVLTGEGADEVFAGYDLFKEAKVRRFVDRQPGSSRRPRLLSRLYPYLPRMQQQSAPFLRAFFSPGGQGAGDPLYSHMPRFRSTAGIKLFYGQETRETLKGYDALADLRDRLPAEFTRWHPLSQAQYLEMTYLLPGYILSSQGDRVAMAHGVESRYPFLDPRLIDFAAQIPPELKLRGLREKHILRESLKDLLPREIGDRPKQPYRAPEGECFVGPQQSDEVRDALSPNTIARGGFFDPGAVQQLVSKFALKGRLGQRDNMALVGVLSTQLWHRAFIGNRDGRTAVPSPITAS
ncbi:asparagine synthase (glutamine-hydrolyzing) [Rhizobiaceae bacterium n13]|uniref:asparagine synthase (glutamine-hydrolyzing) n=1 Tax=Ferirhizobium litorale TaxID=2927786 RepID=A0AAE3QEP0_9HYPH|nr:asparagine synthase (glutamine-hydrolyzing) [Fererhizobium litorale]MDI7861829.1 asparagine synthase (glutamine-hydrolyzing) [Fererhizobium litorale]MDI7921829.1 asparagine synthase (glutamine-hydrolyzing) [Fererhizobium litorale]